MEQEQSFTNGQIGMLLAVVGMLVCAQLLAGMAELIGMALCGLLFVASLVLVQLYD